MTDFTLADLTRFTGAKRRSVQFWAEKKVILEDRTTELAGSGTHRRFSRSEAVMACLLPPFAIRLKISVGELVDISAGIRRRLNEDPVARDIVEKAIEGRESYLFLTSTEPGVWGATFFEPDPTSPKAYEAVGVHAINLLHHEEIGKPGAVTM